jgi:hypothetical protein
VHAQKGSSPSDQVTSDQVTSEKDDEQYHRSYNFKWKIQRRIYVLLPRIPMIQ